MVRVDARASVRAFMPAYLRDNADVEDDDETRWDDVDDDMIMMMMLLVGSLKMPQMTRQGEIGEKNLSFCLLTLDLLVGSFKMDQMTRQGGVM